MTVAFDRSGAGAGSNASGAFALYISRVFGPWHPIVVSSRAPYEMKPDGSFRRGSGGVVSALTSVAAATGADWVACARNDAERDHVREHGGELLLTDHGSRLNLTLVAPDSATYDRFNSVIANPVLWFIQHYLWDLAHEPIIDDRIREAWNLGYVAVNQMLADAVVAVARRERRPPLVMTQDYQLYLAPRAIRRALPNAALQQFIHIPWPTPQYWKILPENMRDGIIDGLLANDIVGFQTKLDVRNFLLSCEELMNLRVDHREQSVLYGGRVVWIRSYPVAPHVGQLERMASSAGVARERERLDQWRPERLIVRVDRTDPSKNIVRGFLAYERLLKAHPEHLGRVQFWAFLQPSRQDVAAYRDYLRRIRQTAHRINSEHGRPGWQPIILELGESMRRAAAAYQDFDVLLVNPIYDGMNLVAKEGMLLNRRDGVLVLSENAGAHEEMGPHSLTINPFDVDQTAAALHEALNLPAATRRRLAEAARHVVRANDVEQWLTMQAQDLRDLVGPARAHAN